jgi:hypothetical protein
MSSGQDTARELDLRYARLVSGHGPAETRDIVWVIETRDDADTRVYEQCKDLYFDTAWRKYVEARYVNQLSDDSDDNPAMVASNMVALKREFEDAWYQNHNFRISDAADAAAFSVLNDYVLRILPRDAAASIPIENVYMYFRRADTMYTQFASAVGTRMNAEHYSRMVYKPSAKLSGSRSYMQGNSGARSSMLQAVALQLHVRKNAARVASDLRRIAAGLAGRGGMPSDVAAWVSRHLVRQRLNTEAIVPAAAARADGDGDGAAPAHDDNGFDEALANAQQNAQQNADW